MQTPKAEKKIKVTVTTEQLCEALNNLITRFAEFTATPENALAIIEDAKLIAKVARPLARIANRKPKVNNAAKKMAALIARREARITEALEHLEVLKAEQKALAEGGAA